MDIISLLPPCFHVAVSSIGIPLHDSSPVEQPLLQLQLFQFSFNTVSSSCPFSLRSDNTYPLLDLWMPHHPVFVSSMLPTPLLLIAPLAYLHLNHLGRILFFDGTLMHTKFCNFMFGFYNFRMFQL